MPGLDGLMKMRELMDSLRSNPPVEIADCPVKIRRDYQPGIETDVQTGLESAIELSGSNVLRYEMEDGTVAIVRPSGTEPKVKVYLMTSGETQAQCMDKINRYSIWAQSLA